MEWTSTTCPWISAFPNAFDRPAADNHGCGLIRPYARRQHRKRTHGPCYRLRMDHMNEESVAERGPQFGPEFRERLRDLLKWRRDVRRFKRAKLPEGTIERLIA